MASNDPERKEEEEAGENAAGEDEDTGAQIAPIVRLEEVAVTTGEENEDVLLDLKSKLYRFDKEGNQWKERGTGSVKILKHKETGKVRLVMRQVKTLKICANHLSRNLGHLFVFWLSLFDVLLIIFWAFFFFFLGFLVLPSIKLQEHAGNDKSCVWHATDFSDGELKDETFCIRFGSVDNCKLFMETVEKQVEAAGKKEEKESKEADDAASKLEKLNVAETKDGNSEKVSSAAAAVNEKEQDNTEARAE